MSPSQSKYGFIEPDSSLESLDIEEIHKKLQVPIFSGSRADFRHLRGADPIFDAITDRTAVFNVAYEDQCTAKYYFDLFNCVRASASKITRIFEVGVYMGGASVILAGCGHEFDLELDLLDISESHLRFTYERIRRIFPEYAKRVRLFLGSVPLYVSEVLTKEQNTRSFLQHDGAHRFDQVVCDLASLYYIKDRMEGMAIQDTHLRGMPAHCNFVDAAAYSVFGFDIKFKAIGSVFSPQDTLVTVPNKYEGNYFLPNTAEGWLVPFSLNTFKYPHPNIPLEAFVAESLKSI